MGAANEHRKYLVVIERAADGSYSAYVPDLPGCASCGETVEDVRQSVREAIALHVEGLRSEGLDVPEPQSTSDYVAAAV